MVYIAQNLNVNRAKMVLYCKDQIILHVYGLDLYC